VKINMGIVHYARNTEVMPLSHVIAGLLSLRGLGLAFALRAQLGRARAVAVSSFAVFALAAIAVTIALTR
jgi:hypothetical protein